MYHSLLANERTATAIGVRGGLTEIARSAELIHYSGQILCVERNGPTGWMAGDRCGYDLLGGHWHGRDFQGVY